jgi:DNA-directed RNA polymerase subunit RPC12/RpoP
MNNTTFKDKNTKYTSFCNNVINKSKIQQGTLDSQYQENIKEFDKNDSTLEKLKIKYEKLKKEYDIIEKADKTNFTPVDIINRANIKINMNNTLNEIKKIQDMDDELDYFNNTADILIKYYSDTNENVIANNDIIDLFNKKNVITNEKAELFNKYLKRTNNIDFNNKKVDIYICNKCNKDRILHQQEGILVCEECGDSKFVLIDSDKPNYKDPSIENKINGSGYKRMNHFSELLNQFQGKESTEISPEIFDKIIQELHKQRLTDMSQVTNQTLRATLKKLGLNSYYEHIPYIINKLSGISPPTLSRELEDKLRQMFKEVQEPFMKFKNKSRKNFLNSHYVFHKLFELLEKDEYLCQFNYLKSRQKLYEHDEVWEKICNYNNWTYIKSI